MFNYIAFLHGGIRTATEDAFADGQSLGLQCVRQLKAIDNPEQFPPRLLILLASPAYREQAKADQLVAGVQRAFVGANYGELELIGSSVAAVFFGQEIHEKGAVLICLASRLLEAKVAVGPNPIQDADGAIRELLNGLGFESPLTEDPNPFGDRTLLTFLPGGSKDFSSKDLHKHLSEAVMGRLAIVGGVSSVNDPDRAEPGLQFAGHNAYSGALVAACIATGCQFGLSLGTGLDATRKFVHIKTISKDMTKIEAFHEGLPAEALKEQTGLVLLGRKTRDHELVVALRRSGAGNQPIEVLRGIKENLPLEILQPDPKRMREAAAQAVQRCIQKFSMENLVGCLALMCTSHYRYREEIDLGIEGSIKQLEELLGGKSCVGGFVDGEAAIDKSGRSIFANWSVAAIAFGDAMRARTPSQRGFAALEQYSPELYKVASIQEIIQESLQLIYDVGFPGAMISLLMPVEDKLWIVAHSAVGSRFKRIVQMTCRDLDGGDILAEVAREGEVKFIPDSREWPSADQDAVKEAGIISQFVLPLRGKGTDVLATLQVDLGDVSYRKRGLAASADHVLRSLGVVIGESLRRVFNWEEVRIVGEFDQTLLSSLSATSVEAGLQRFLERALKAYNLDTAHVRLADAKREHLRLVAGSGPYYEAARNVRPIIDILDGSRNCLAFQKGVVVVVNDREKDIPSMALCERLERLEHGSPARKALEEMESYVNVVFKDEKGKSAGTIVLGSRKKWSFPTPYLRHFNAMAQKAGILVEHLRRKQSEEENRKRLAFLLAVGPQLGKISDLADPQAVLKEATTRFCHAAKAQVACLYLWTNEECTSLVLRAQEGWSDARLVDTAHYDGKGWTGSMAQLDQPRYFHDLRNFKQEKRGEPLGKYLIPMFGSVLPVHLTLEVIALPLRVGENRLGVLTLYRRIPTDEPGDTSGFSTVDTKALEEAADYMSGLVSIWKSFRLVRESQEAQELAYRSRCEALAIASMVCQGYHVSEDLLTVLSSQLIVMRANLAKSGIMTVEEGINSLEDRIREARKIVEQLDDNAEKIRSPNTKAWRLVDNLRPVVNNIRAKYSARGIKEEFDVSEEILVDINYVLVQEVFRNVVGNAFKYSQQGGSVIIRASMPANDGSASIICENTGTPMDKSLIEEAMAGVTRVQGCLRRSRGIFIAKNLVESQGGAFSIEPRGRGTRVSITLPAKSKESL